MKEYITIKNSNIGEVDEKYYCCFLYGSFSVQNMDIVSFLRRIVLDIIDKRCKRKEQGRIVNSALNTVKTSSSSRFVSVVDS